MNKILGEGDDRLGIAELQNAIDTKLTHKEQPLTLIDTAGLRRRSKVEKTWVLQRCQDPGLLSAPM